MSKLLSAAVLSIALLSAQAQAATPISLAISADMSGGAKHAGEAIRRGAFLAMQEINAHGGLLGRKVRLEVHDHRGNPARGLDNIEELGRRSDILAVIGGVHTPVALNAIDSIHENNLLYLGAWAAGTPIVSNGHDPNYVFRVSVRDEYAGEFLVSSAMKSGAKRLGLILERTGWGRSNHRAITAAAERHNVEIGAVSWVNWGATDVIENIEALQAAKVDTVLLVANVAEAALVTKAVARIEKNSRPSIISHWGIAAGDFVSKTGPKNIAKVDLRFLHTFSFAGTNRPQKAEALLTRYQYAFGANITPAKIRAPFGTAHAYDLVHLLAKAVEKARSLDRSKVRLALENLEHFDGVMREYAPPFTKKRHDALDISDFRLSRFSPTGTIISAD